MSTELGGKFYIAEIWIFDLFCSCDFDLDHLADDLHIRTWPVFSGDIVDVQMWTSYVKSFESYRLTDIHTYRQDRNYIGYYTPLWWSKKKENSKCDKWQYDLPSARDHTFRNPHQSCHVGLGLTDVVKNVKFHQNQFRGFWLTEGSKSARFLCSVVAKAYITGRPTVQPVMNSQRDLRDSISLRTFEMKQETHHFGQCQWRTSFVFSFSCDFGAAYYLLRRSATTATTQRTTRSAQLRACLTENYLLIHLRSPDGAITLLSVKMA